MFKAVKKIEPWLKSPQDRAEILERANGLVIVLADGAGGTTGGAAAADAAVMWVKAFVSRAAEDELRDGACWRDLLLQIDQQVSFAGGQTTAVVAAASPEGIVGASVGDSAAWLIGGGGREDLTAAQVRKPLIGSGLARPVAFQAKPFDGTLLVASDGLVKYAPARRICETALEANLDLAARKLVHLARLQSGALPDDVSLVLCRKV